MQPSRALAATRFSPSPSLTIVPCPDKHQLCILLSHVTKPSQSYISSFVYFSHIQLSQKAIFFFFSHWLTCGLNLTCYARTMKWLAPLSHVAILPTLGYPISGIKPKKKKLQVFLHDASTPHHLIYVRTMTHL